MALGAGCGVQQPLTPEEIAAKRERQLKMGTRFYPDKKPEEILLAADRVFSLADDDYIVSHLQDEIRAKRAWYHFFTLALSSGTDDWTVKVSEENGGTKVITQCIHEMIQSRKGPVVVTDEDLYSLFYDRLENILDIQSVWLTCRDARKKYSGFLNPLCSVATDRTPDGKSSAQRNKDANTK